MNKLFIPIIFLVCLVMTACGNDDEPKPEFSAEYLEATVWDAELTGVSTPKPYSAHFVMQFLSKKNGKCIAAYGNDDYVGNFTFSITKEMITFNGSIVGNWNVVKQTKTTIVLQSFQPYELNLVLTKK